jgi:acyl-CoA thioesterase FadM
MVRTALLEGGFDDVMVTAKMEVVYRRATPTGAPLTVVGRLLQRGATRARAEAEVRLADGTVTARAEAVLAKQPPEVASGWAAERPFWRVDEG